jgi:hypothetical protein
MTAVTLHASSKSVGRFEECNLFGDVELDPVKECFIANRSTMSGTSSKSVEVFLASSAKVGLVD